MKANMSQGSGRKKIIALPERHRFQWFPTILRLIYKPSSDELLEQRAPVVFGLFSRADLLNDTANSSGLSVNLYGNEKVSLGFGYSAGDNESALSFSIRVDL